MKEMMQLYHELADQINIIGYSDNVQAARKAQVTAEQARQQGHKLFALFFEGEHHFFLGKFEQAYKLEKMAAEQLPEVSFILSNFATVATSLGYYDEAFDSYDEALRLDPHNTHALCCKAVALSQIGRDREAMELFDQALLLPATPYYWQVLVNKAILLSRQGLPMETLVYLDRALEFQPSNVQILNKKGTNLFHLGREEEAIACFEKALSIQPDNDQTLRNLGASLCRNNLFRDALEFFRRIPGPVLNYDDLAWMTMIYDHLGDYDKAVSMAKEWIDSLKELDLPIKDAEKYLADLTTKREKKTWGDF
ncbi:tetratricopeptide repeat protein [bacterium]|nr:tetratricopeptide repeat protein [bacterium]